jgi:trk system potassium uptake protein TrkH
MRLNFKLIASILGLLAAFNGGFMLLCLPFSLYFKDDTFNALLLSSAISLVAGVTIFYLYKQPRETQLRKREGYVIVTTGWLTMSLTGTLPYILSGSIPSFTNAFFETLSGYSTTGASILTDIESLDKGILLWRSLTQWIGGMGIIVLTVAIIPMLGIGGMQLFMAEAPGITPDKLKPRIADTAKRLWLIYIGLTGLEAVLLMLGDMGFYDAINHALTTMATGGFSTKNASVAHFTSPYIHYVIIIFMFLAGTNFTLTYFGLHGQLKKVWENEEFRNYLLNTLGFSLFVGVIVYFVADESMEESFRNALFQVVSIITTTGYVTADFTSWTPFVLVIFFMLMFVGGSAGSTAGGVKVVRHIVLLKNSLLELRRQMHPHAVIPVRLNNKAIDKDITSNVLAFLIIYFIVFSTGSIIVAAFDIDFLTSIGAVATCLGNIGPGIGSVGPVDNFAHLPAGSKWFLTFLMLLGRLELFTVLILFTPSFWRQN